MKYFPILLILIFMGCKDENSMNSFSLSTMKCNPDETPEYDYKVVQIVDRETQETRDTTVDQVRKYRKVFKPCREMIYQAVFRSSDGAILSDQPIKMMATGKRWQFAPHKQDEISIQYQFDQKDVQANASHQLNKGISNPWMGEVKEGVVENEEEVWMHPFRFNQYNFTEVAPFPKVQNPGKLKIGDNWTWNLGNLSGWGDWDGAYGNSKYEVTAFETISTPYGTIEECWKIEATSKWDFGTSALNFWFHEDLGFVKKEYTNYGNQTLSIVLKEVIDN